MTEVIALLEASKTAPDFEQGDRGRGPQIQARAEGLQRAAPQAGRRSQDKGRSVGLRPSEEDRAPGAQSRAEPGRPGDGRSPGIATNPVASRSQAGACQDTAAQAVGNGAVPQGVEEQGASLRRAGVDCRLAAALVGFSLFSRPPQGNDSKDHGTDRSVSTPTPASTPSPNSTHAPIPTPARTQQATETEPYVETAQFVGHGHNHSVEATRVLPDGKRLVTTSTDKTAQLWDIATGHEVRRFWHPAPVRPIALVPPDGHRAVTGCLDGIVRLWDLESGKLIRTLATHSKPVWGVAVSRDGHVAISGGEDKVLLLSDVDDGSLIARLACPVERTWSVAISPDGRRSYRGRHRRPVAGREVRQRTDATTDSGSQEIHLGRCI